MYKDIKREPMAATGAFNEPAPFAGTIVSDGVALEDAEPEAVVEVPSGTTMISYRYVILIRVV